MGLNNNKDCVTSHNKELRERERIQILSFFIPCHPQGTDFGWLPSYSQRGCIDPGIMQRWQHIEPQKNYSFSLASSNTIEWGLKKSTFYCKIQWKTPILHKLFQRKEEETLPKSLHEATITMIQKSDKDITRKENYRSYRYIIPQRKNTTNWLQWYVKKNQRHMCVGVGVYLYVYVFMMAKWDLFRECNCFKIQK